MGLPWLKMTNYSSILLKSGKKDWNYWSKHLTTNQISTKSQQRFTDRAHRLTW